MKRVTVFTLPDKRESVLQKLRELAILHLDESHHGFSVQTQHVEDALALSREALGFLPETKAPTVQSVWEESCDVLVQKVHVIAEKHQETTSDLEALVEKVNWYNRWGKPSHTAIQAAQGNGVTYFFLQIPDAEVASFLEELGPTYATWQGTSNDGQTPCVVVGQELTCPREWLDPAPTESLGQLQKQIGQLEDKQSQEASELVHLSHCRGDLEHHIQQLELQLKLQHIHEGMDTALQGEICTLGGYIPEDKVATLLEAAETDGYAVVVEDVEEDDESVPTETRNPAWVNSMRSLFGFFGSVPGYREPDTHWDAMLILPVLVALLIGDAGYGAIYLLGVWQYSRRAKNPNHDAIRLGYALSGACLIWGALTGNWFGSQWISGLPGLRHVVVPSLATCFDLSNLEGIKGGIFTTMKISFLIGLVHLGFSRIRAGLHALGQGFERKALVHLGWLLIVVAMYLLTQAMFFAAPTMNATLILVGVGSLFVCWFQSDEPNILKRISLSLVGLLMDLSGVFGDILSYLRLFAVGFAAFILALLSNMLLENATGAALLFLGVIVTIFGHLLNLVLGLLALMVHGFRLHLLEGSKHLEVESNGTPYRPFNHHNV
ncbi:MAG: hypothetical protein EP343_12045 [Deltaproteobacteria bacterium]|nr:MAG: hypothetical protein EP343_12045 [Deltaproteobacteria bacterium]